MSRATVGSPKCPLKFTRNNLPDATLPSWQIVRRNSSFSTVARTPNSEIREARIPEARTCRVCSDDTITRDANCQTIQLCVPFQVTSKRFKVITRVEIQIVVVNSCVIVLYKDTLKHFMEAYDEWSISF